jgi:predicted DNA-binding WGR domain protein
MGISTFAHLLTEEEQQLVAMLGPMDDVIKAVVHGLCERPFLQSEEKGEEVDVRELIRKVLGDSKDALGGTFVHLEQKTKFWEAKLEGSSVLVRYGKKKTEGQTNSHVGPDAQEYFDKKVKEKLRSGYKVVDPHAALRKKVLAAVEKSAAESKAKGGVKHRADFDKAAELLTFLVTRATGIEAASQLEMFGAVFGLGRGVGQDVCYGEVYLVSPEQVAAVAPKIAALTEEKLLEQFDLVDAEGCYGGLANVSREREGEYVSIHFRTLKLLVEECVQFNCGLLVHFW